MTFNDIFKSSFLENVTAVSLLDMVLALALAFGLGMFIFLVYKKTYQGVMYSSSFGVTLVALTMITTLVILAVTSNVVLLPHGDQRTAGHRVFVLGNCRRYRAGRRVYSAGGVRKRDHRCDAPCICEP